MSVWSKVLSNEERLEVEQLVIESFKDSETGTTRSTSAAKHAFVESVRVAEAAGRSWADLLLSEWAEEGAGNFALRLWKRRDAFTASVKGKQRSRSMNRGRRERDEAGKAFYTQDSLLNWTEENLRNELIAEVTRRSDAAFNVDMYGALLRLIKESGTEPVGVALSKIGMSLDEYLASEDVAS